MQWSEYVCFYTYISQCKCHFQAIPATILNDASELLSPVWVSAPKAKTDSSGRINNPNTTLKTTIKIAEAATETHIITMGQKLCIMEWMCHRRHCTSFNRDFRVVRLLYCKCRHQQNTSFSFPIQLFYQIFVFVYLIIRIFANGYIAYIYFLLSVSGM